jgi:hypothetical protein
MRLQILLIAGIAVPTVVADAVLVNTVSSPEARNWSITGLSGFALGLVAVVLWFLRRDPVVRALEWRAAWVARVLSPRREWARIATEALLSAVVAAALALILHGAAPHLASEAEAGIAVLTFVVVLVIAPHLLRYSRAGLYRKLDVIASEADGHGHDVVMEVLERNLEAFSATVKGLKSESGLRMNRAEIIGWTIHCFANARGRYRGADSNVPGQYNTRYPTGYGGCRWVRGRPDRPICGDRWTHWTSLEGWMFSKCSHAARFMADRAYSARKGTGLNPAGIRAPVSRSPAPSRGVRRRSYG